MPCTTPKVRNFGDASKFFRPHFLYWREHRSHGVIDPDVDVPNSFSTDEAAASTASGSAASVGNIKRTTARGFDFCRGSFKSSEATREQSYLRSAASEFTCDGPAKAG